MSWGGLVEIKLLEKACLPIERVRFKGRGRKLRLVMLKCLE